MKNRQLNREEEVLRDKLNELNYDYQPSDWNAIEKHLPSSAGKGWMSGKVLAGAAVVVTLTAAWFFINPKQDAEASAQQEQVINQQKSSDQATEKSTQNVLEKASGSKIEITAETKSKPVDKIEDKTAEKQAISENTLESSNPIEERTPSAVMAKEAEAAKGENEVIEAANREEEVIENQTRPRQKVVIKGLLAPDKICQDQLFRIQLDMQGNLPKGYTVDWYADEQVMIKNSEISGVAIRENDISKLSAKVKDEQGKLLGTYHKEIQTVNLAEIDFTYEDLEDPYYDLTAEVRVTDDNYQSYEWIDEDGKVIATGKSASLNFSKKGIYDVALKAKTIEGCYRKVSKPLAIEEDFDPLAPNTFTPLVQDGDNDLFMPEAFKIRDDQFKMQIMKVDGNLVFESNNINDEWNGRMHNSGQMMPAGLYLWKVMIISPEGRNRTFIGNIRILTD